MSDKTVGHVPPPLPGNLAADLAVIRDPYNKGISSDKARVRVLNASFNQSNVDVYLTPAATDLAGVTPNFGTQAGTNNGSTQEVVNTP